MGRRWQLPPLGHCVAIGQGGRSTVPDHTAGKGTSTHPHFMGWVHFSSHSPSQRQGPESSMAAVPSLALGTQLWGDGPPLWGRS